MTDILILDLATTTTLLHEGVAKITPEESPSIGIIYFNRVKFRNSPVSRKYFISLTETKTPSPEEIYREIERGSEIRVSRALHLDRYIQNKATLKKFVDHYLTQFSVLLEQLKPKTIIGELSLSWEILTYGLCAARGITYLLPLNTYVFSQPRLAFFNINHDLQIIHRIAESSQAKIDDEQIHSLIQGRTKADINKNFGDRLRKNLNPDLWRRFRYNLRNFDTSDYRESLLRKGHHRIANMVRGKINTQYLRRRGRVDLTQPYFLLLLHVQPEVTPDTTATFFANQTELIRQISLRLPYGFKLYVKEHPNGIGSRGLRTLRQIAEMPNTEFLHPSIKSNIAIGNAVAVVTIAGTASFEAALSGVPSAVFNNVYFSCFPGIQQLKHYGDLSDFLTQCARDWPRKADRPATLETSTSGMELLRTIYAGTYSCIWHQPLLMPGVLDSENVRKIRSAIISTHRVLHDSERG